MLIGLFKLEHLQIQSLLFCLHVDYGFYKIEIKTPFLEYLLFFEHYAYRYRVDYSAAEFQKMLSDEHSMGSVRVNGMVQHMDAWYELYDVVEGDSLYLPEEERVVIW